MRTSAITFWTIFLSLGLLVSCNREAVGKRLEHIPLTTTPENYDLSDYASFSLLAKRTEKEIHWQLEILPTMTSKGPQVVEKMAESHGDFRYLPPLYPGEEDASSFNTYSNFIGTLEFLEEDGFVVASFKIGARTKTKNGHTTSSGTKGTLEPYELDKRLIFQSSDDLAANDISKITSARLTYQCLDELRDMIAKINTSH